MKTKNKEEAIKNLIGAVVHLQLVYGASNQEIMDTILICLEAKQSRGEKQDV